ncbi:MAG: hypothetical protein J2P44_14570, partial [Candidatus Dormibacteraeota bacterium]|nr:hypothetical protein [Candidatus Dormibacteraeota bacterium]
PGCWFSQGMGLTVQSTALAVLVAHPTITVKTSTNRVSKTATLRAVWLATVDAIMVWALPQYSTRDPSFLVRGGCELIVTERVARFNGR